MHSLVPLLLLLACSSLKAEYKWTGTEWQWVEPDRQPLAPTSSVAEGSGDRYDEDSYDDDEDYTYDEYDTWAAAGGGGGGFSTGGNSGYDSVGKGGKNRGKGGKNKGKGGGGGGGLDPFQSSFGGRGGTSYIQTDDEDLVEGSGGSVGGGGRSEDDFDPYYAGSGDDSLPPAAGPLDPVFSGGPTDTAEIDLDDRRGGSSSLLPAGGSDIVLEDKKTTAGSADSGPAWNSGGSTDPGRTSQGGGYDDDLYDDNYDDDNEADYYDKYDDEKVVGGGGSDDIIIDDPWGVPPATPSYPVNLPADTTTTTAAATTARPAITTTSTTSPPYSPPDAGFPPVSNNGGGQDTPIIRDIPANRPVSFFAQPGILAAVIGGAVVGLLCAILLVMFIVYRMRKKDEGSYILDEPKRTHNGNLYTKTPNKEFFA